MKRITVAGACVNQTPLDWTQNLNNLMDAVRAAKAQQVDILCLPELALTGYGCEDAFFSRDVTQRALQQLEALARVCDGITVSVGLPLEFEHSLYNATALIHDGKVMGFVAKQDLAGDGVHYEPRWFRRWPRDGVNAFEWNGETYPLGDILFEVDGVRIGFEICEDAWNGVRPAQDHYLSNADVIMNPSASHFAFGKSKVRELLVTETSRAFSCAYVYSNLLGNESGRIIYDGEILIAQGGKLLARNRRFSFAQWDVTWHSLDVELLRSQRKKSFNFQAVTPDNLVRVPGRLTGLNPLHSGSGLEESGLNTEQEFLLAETLGLFDYMRKSRSRGFVISMSGGADSSACAVLVSETVKRAKEELGEAGFRERLSYLHKDGGKTAGMRELLAGVYQSTSNSSQQTLESARALAEETGADFDVWDVQSLFDTYRSVTEPSLGRKLDWKQDDITLQNIQARLRSPGIWMLANFRNALLLATSNRSEAAVGYATMDGDTSGGLMPLGGVDKAFIIHWLKWAEKELGYASLAVVNGLQPTAELRPPGEHQTDEGDLMPYTVLNQIEKCAIRDYQSPADVFESLRGLYPDDQLKAWIARFFTLWSRNQWKRERYAPSFHLDDENLDPKTWCRFPILSGGFREALDDMYRK